MVRQKANHDNQSQRTIAMLDIKDMLEEPLKLFATLKGVTLHSINIEEIKAPFLNFHDNDSQIQIMATVVLDYSGLYQAAINMVFTTFERVASLDKQKAAETIKKGKFFCDYQSNDEWEYDGKLHVDVTTKDKRITESLNEYDCEIDIDYDKERDEHQARLAYTLAGEISEYFTNYMGGFRYGPYDKQGNQDKEAASEHRVLGDAITKALVTQACIKLGEPADTELEFA